MADPRVTKFGRFLRKSHLDELPQLFNVLAGDMTLIGPRPERPEFTQFLAQEVPGYVARLTVKPGITGMAQINLPPDTDLDSVRRKLELDLDYIYHSNLWVDIRIMLCTALKVFGFPGHKLAKLFGLRRRPTGLVAETLGAAPVQRQPDQDQLPEDQRPEDQPEQRPLRAVNGSAAEADVVHLRPLSLEDAWQQVERNGNGRVNGSASHSPAGTADRGLAAVNGHRSPNGRHSAVEETTAAAAAGEETQVAVDPEPLEVSPPGDPAAGHPRAGRRKRSLS